MFRKLQKNSLLQALALNLVFLLVYLVFSSNSYAALDDFFMAAVLEGAYDGLSDTHLFFVNSVYGFLLKPLYLLFPSVGWYYIFEVIEVFAAFTIFTYVLLKRLDLEVGLILSLVLLCCVSPDFYFQLSFTQNGALLTASGVLLLLMNLRTPHRLWFICGLLLFVLGFVMRKESFLLGIPYVAFFAFLSLVKKNNLKILLITVLSSAVVLLGLYYFEKSQYIEPEYKYYASYQGPRAAFVDGGFFDVNAFYDELAESGYEKTNAQAIRTWLFYDTEIFHLDSLPRLLNAVENTRYELNWSHTVIRIVQEIANGFKNTSVWCWALFCLLILFYSKKKLEYYPWISLGIISMEILYLCMVNRLVYRVESGIWLYAIAFTIVYLPQESLSSFCNQWQKKVAIVVACFLAFAFAIMEQPQLQRSKIIGGGYGGQKAWSEFYEYAKNNKDKAFVMNFGQYKALGEYLKIPSYKALGPGGLSNIFPLGYWNAYLPGMLRQQERYNLQNPLKDFINPNVYMVESEKNMFLSAKTFYEVNYKSQLNSEIVKRFGDLKVVKYTVKENEK